MNAWHTCGEGCGTEGERCGKEGEHCGKEGEPRPALGILRVLVVRAVVRVAAVGLLRAGAADEYRRVDVDGRLIASRARRCCRPCLLFKLPPLLLVLRPAEIARVDIDGRVEAGRQHRLLDLRVVPVGKGVERRMSAVERRVRA